MSHPLPLHVPAKLDQAIRIAGEQAYPNECCGILFGRERNGIRELETLEAVDNSYESAEQYHRFSITAKVLMAAEKRAATEGRLVLGFYHSHPDHPARPSEFDREHAWPFYSYIIVAIEKRRSAALTSWQLNDVTEQFDSQDIQISSHGLSPVHGT